MINVNKLNKKLIRNKPTIFHPLKLQKIQQLLKKIR